VLIFSPSSFRLFIRLAFTTSLAFSLLFLPFLPPFADRTAILDVITRLFPFDRGLFEDKVANFWCASNVAFKWKTWVARPMLVKFSAGLTAVGFLPSVVGLMRSGIKMGRSRDDKGASTPMLPLLPYALLTSSMSFFLFSFQVHEKTILLPLLPMTLLMSSASMDSSLYGWGALLNNVGVFRQVPSAASLAASHLIGQHVAVVEERWTGLAIYCDGGIVESVDWLQSIPVT
jgi:alpha-1,3-glucosyltransferase